MDHYAHKDHVDLTQNYCYLCDVDIALDHDRAIVERFFTPSDTDTHLETEVLSRDPEMGLESVNSGQDFDKVEAEMLAEVGSTR